MNRWTVDLAGGIVGSNLYLSLAAGRFEPLPKNANGPAGGFSRKMLNHKYKVKSARCPNCSELLDGATGGSRAPEPGDYTVCLYCASPARFTDTLELEAISVDQIEDSEIRETLQTFVDAIQRKLAS